MRASRVRLAARAGDSKIRISAPRYATTGLPQPLTHAEGMTTFDFDVRLGVFTAPSFHSYLMDGSIARWDALVYRQISRIPQRRVSKFAFLGLPAVL